MGPAYAQYVIPEALYWNARPTREEVVGVVDILMEHGWLRPEGDSPPDSLVFLRPSRAVSLIRNTPPDHCLSILLEGGGLAASSSEPGDHDADFGPTLCEDVRLIDSPAALIVPTGDLDLGLSCPRCSYDLLGPLRLALPELRGDEQSQPYPWLAAQGYHRFPDRCTACDAALNPLDLAMTSALGRLEEAPLFRFGIALSAATCRVDVVGAGDTALLHALFASTGVPFRSIARWG